MKKMLYLSAMSVVLLLTGCGGNSLTGKWTGAQGGAGGTIEFTSNKMVTITNSMGTTKEVEIAIKEYKVEKNRVGVVVESGKGLSETTWFDIIDPDTIKMKLGFMDAIFHRVK